MGSPLGLTVWGGVHHGVESMVIEGILGFAHADMTLLCLVLLNQ